MNVICFTAVLGNTLKGKIKNLQKDFTHLAGIYFDKKEIFVFRFKIRLFRGIWPILVTHATRDKSRISI